MWCIARHYFSLDIGRVCFIIAHNDGHPIDFPPTRIKAIQAIQDDPLIDAELNPHDGIGTAMGHGHHYSHGYHHGEGHAYGGNRP